MSEKKFIKPTLILTEEEVDYYTKLAKERGLSFSEFVKECLKTTSNGVGLEQIHSSLEQLEQKLKGLEQTLEQIYSIDGLNSELKSLSQKLDELLDKIAITEKGIEQKLNSMTKTLQQYSESNAKALKSFELAINQQLRKMMFNIYGASVVSVLLVFSLIVMFKEPDKPSSQTQPQQYYQYQKTQQYYQQYQQPQQYYYQQQAR